MRHRHGEIGLALLAEVDRSEVDAVRYGLDEGRFGRAVGAGADHGGGEPRHAQLLAALAVELYQLGDRRYLAQQADVVEAAVLDRQARPLRLGHPADLVLDAAHEGFDALGGGFRLLLLDLDRGAPVVLVDEIQIERGIDHQHAGDQADEQDDVLEEQSTLHSTTSSACTNTDCGTAASSARAAPTSQAGVAASK